jgi:hypothetical protein
VPPAVVRPRAIAGVLLALALRASTARAQTPTVDVDALVQEGVALRQAGRDDEAAAVFAHAVVARREGRTLAQLSQAEQALGRWVDADAHLREALTYRDEPWIVRNREALESALAVIDGRVGSLLVRGGPAGATVHVDGRRVATLPMEAPARVRAGRVAVEVAAPGHVAVQRAVEVEPRATAREEVWLVRARLDTVSPTVRPDTTPRAAPQAPVRLSPEDDASGREVQRTLAWVALIGAGLGVGLGTTGIILRERAVTRFNADARCSLTDAAVLGGPACEREYVNATDMGFLTVGGFVATGILGVSSAVLFLTLPRDGTGARRALRVGCAPMPGGASCAAAF